MPNRSRPNQPNDPPPPPPPPYTHTCRLSVTFCVRSNATCKLLQVAAWLFLPRAIDGAGNRIFRRLWPGGIGRPHNLVRGNCAAVNTQLFWSESTESFQPPSTDGHRCAPPVCSWGKDNRIVSKLLWGLSLVPLWASFLLASLVFSPRMKLPFLCFCWVLCYAGARLVFQHGLQDPSLTTGIPIHTCIAPTDRPSALHVLLHDPSTSPISLPSPLA